MSRCAKIYMWHNAKWVQNSSFGEILCHDYQVQYNYGTSQVWSISTKVSVAFGVEMLVVRNVSLAKGF